MDFLEWQATIVTGLFILFIVWDISLDIANPLIKGVTWINPGKALVLSALTVQLVGYFDRKHIDIFAKSKEEQVKVLIDNELFIDGARLCFFVFLGYIQPQMASAKSGGRWTNIAALSLSLSLHIATEIFALENVSEAGKLRYTEFVSSSVVFLVGSTCLVIYLGLTILAGKFIRDSLSLKIPHILSEDLTEGNKLSSFKLEKISQIISEDLPEDLPEGDGLCRLREKICRLLSEDHVAEDDRPSSFRFEMLKSWTVAFAWKAQYKLATSAFIPAVGMIVTICVAVVGNNARRLLLHRSELGSLSSVSYLQCVFIIIGWISILCRWFMAVTFYAKSTDRKLNDVFHCTNRFAHLLFRFMQVGLNPMQLINESYRKPKPSTILWATVSLLIWTIFFTVLIPLMLFIAVIHLLFYFSYFTWVLSTLIMLVFKSFVAEESESSAPNVPAKEDEDFLKCKDSLQQLFYDVQNHEEVNRLWKYHLKSYNQRKPRIKESYEEIKKCQEFSKVFSGGENNRNFVKKLEKSIQKCQPELSNLPFKMVAVAVIEMMVRLVNKFEWDMKKDVQGVGVEEIINLYKEIKDLLEFFDCPENIAIDSMDMFGTCNFEAFEMSLEADKQIAWIEKEIKQPEIGGDAQEIPTCQSLFDFLKKENEEIEGEMENLERDEVGECGCGILGILLECSLIFPFASVFGACEAARVSVEKLVEPVNEMVKSVDGFLKVVLKSLLYVYILIIVLFLFPLVIIFAPLFILIILMILFSNYMSRYFKSIALMKSRQFVYTSILDLENKCNSEEGKIVVSNIGKEVMGCFRELVQCCVQQLPGLLIKQSRKWAEEFEEDKISKAVEIAEKVRALMDIMDSEKGDINAIHDSSGVENDFHEIDVMDSE